MSDPNLDPLPPNVVELLAAERQRSGAPLEVQARARRRMELFLVMGAAGAVGALGGAAAVGASAGASSIPHRALTLLAKLFTRPGLGILTALAAGGGVGAGLHAALETQEPPRVVYVDRVVTAPPVENTASAVAEPSSVSSAEPPLVVAPPSSAAATSSSAASAREPSLASERLLLEAARTALARGDSASALAALERHAAKFPRGQLSEERDALSVQALAAAGRGEEAKRRADQFHRQHSGSILAPAVDSAAGTVP